SISEAYVVTEALTFCSMYLRGVKTRINRSNCNEIAVDAQPNHILSVFNSVGHPLGKKDITILNPSDPLKAELYIMNNCPEVQKYL
ncbi:hypothetical protein PanWU01x14_137310, partial [Parasponia andersonii]